MVLYYFFPRASPDDVDYPLLLGSMHYSLKGLQCGLIGGFVTGALAGKNS